VLHQLAPDYTVVDKLSRAFPTSFRTISGETELEELARGCGKASVADLADPGLGTAVRSARTSWVRLITLGEQQYYCKTYVYPTLAWQLRSLARTAPWQSSRAAMEAAALVWLQHHGFPGPRVAGLVEWRRFGLLARALLVTQAWPGVALDTLLPTLPPDSRQQVARALGRFVAALHRLGFRDRNLDLRNLLAAATPDGGFAIAKIDSGRHRLVRPGPPRDRLARTDWARLLPQLRPFGLDAIALAAGSAT
jgi:hypothetical protein